jgi:hypothetical protein
MSFGLRVGVEVSGAGAAVVPREGGEYREAAPRASTRGEGEIRCPERLDRLGSGGVKKVLAQDAHRYHRIFTMNDGKDTREVA